MRRVLLKRNIRLLPVLGVPGEATAKYLSLTSHDGASMSCHQRQRPGISAGEGIV